MNVKLAICLCTNLQNKTPKINSYITLIYIFDFKSRRIKRWKRIEERKGEKFRKFKYPSNEMRNEEIHGPMKI